MLMFSVAHADVNTSGLNETQKAELALQAAKMKESFGSISTGTAVSVNDAAIDGVRKWGTVSTEIAKGLVVGLAAAAKEANIAVNEFSQTPVGKVTTVIIVWKMIGHDVIKIFLALLLTFGGCPFIWFIYNRVTRKNVVFDYQPRLWGLFHRKVLVSFNRDTADGFSTVIMVIAMCAAIISAAVIIN